MLCFSCVSPEPYHDYLEENKKSHHQTKWLEIKAQKFARKRRALVQSYATQVDFKPREAEAEPEEEQEECHFL